MYSVGCVWNKQSRAAKDAFLKKLLLPGDVWGSCRGAKRRKYRNIEKFRAVRDSARFPVIVPLGCKRCQWDFKLMGAGHGMFEAYQALRGVI